MSGEYESQACLGDTLDANRECTGTMYCLTTSTVLSS
jgi:hypothetical protein